jgi:MFS family permease
MRAGDLVLRARAGYDGWIIIGVVFLAAGLTIGTSNYAFGLFIEPLENSFGWRRTAISASLSFMAVGSLTGPMIGRAMDRYGARPIMVVSLIVFGSSFLLRPFIQDLWHLYALSVLQFAGFSGTAMLPAGRLVGIWFPNSRGRAMGFATMGNNFGGLTMPLLAGLVMANAAGWPAIGTGEETTWKAAFVVIAAISFVLAFLALVIVHERPVLRGGGDAARPEAPRPVLEGWTVREALSTRGFYAMALAMALATFTYSAVLPHVGAHLEIEGLPDGAVLTAVALLATFGMAGKLLFGYVAERITARRAMMLTLTGQCVFILVMVVEPSRPLIWVSVPMYGLFMGSYGVLSTLVMQEAYGIRFFGSISGLAGMASVVSLISGPLVAGASADGTGGYGLAFVGIAAMFVVAVVAMTQVPGPRPRTAAR